jgi:hypothetical protein
MNMNDNDDGPCDGDYRKDDEKRQTMHLNANGLSKDEVELELTKAKESI